MSDRGPSGGAPGAVNGDRAGFDERLGSLTAIVATLREQLGPALAQPAANASSESAAEVSGCAPDRSDLAMALEVMRGHLTDAEQLVGRAMGALQEAASAERALRAALGSLPPAGESAAGIPGADELAADEPVVTAPAPTPAGRGAPWLPDAMRGLAREDGASAGRLILQLLPIHATLVTGPMEYDLSIAEVGTLAVSVGDRVWVAERDEPRPADAVAFHVQATLAELAELVLGDAGRPRASGVRISGDAQLARTLVGLGRIELGLIDLSSAGIVMDPYLAYLLVAQAVGVTEAAQRPFALLHEVLGHPGWSCTVTVEPSRPIRVTRGRSAEPDAVLCCRPEGLLPILAGRDPAACGAQLRGGGAPLALLQRWLAAAGDRSDRRPAPREV